MGNWGEITPTSGVLTLLISGGGPLCSCRPLLEDAFVVYHEQYGSFAQQCRTRPVSEFGCA